MGHVWSRSTRIRICDLFLLLGFCFLESGFLSAAETRRWALLVGVDQYTSIENLEFSGNDQRTLASELSKLQFPTDQISVVHDLAKQKRYLPFRENIEREIDLLNTMAKPGDIVLFSFSGHGVHIDGKSYLCPTEADLSRPAETLIPLDSVFRRMANCPASFKVMMVDACRNDPRPRGARAARGDRSITTTFAQSLERPPNGVVLLTSCSPGETSMEDDKLQHGVFMHYVLDGLRGRAANKDGLITLSSLYDYASIETKKHVAKRWAGFQSPGFKGEVNGPFEFVRVRQSKPENDQATETDKDVAVRSPITGIWNGVYKYSTTNRAPVGFSMVVIQDGRELTGFIRESNTFGRTGAPWLHASFRGTYDAQTGDMTFLKTYDGTATVAHDVRYSGRIQNGRINNGNWRISNTAYGTFDLTKDQDSSAGRFSGLWSGTRYFPEVLDRNPVKFSLVIVHSPGGVYGFMKERRANLDGDDPWYHANVAGRIAESNAGAKIRLTYDGTANKTDSIDLSGTLGTDGELSISGEWTSPGTTKGDFSLTKVPSARW